MRSIRVKESRRPTGCMVLAGACLTILACERKPAGAPEKPVPAPEKPAGVSHEADDHAHVHVPPHGGLLVPLGEEFANFELVFDAATGTLTAYALDGHAENPVRLAQPEIKVTIQALRRGDQTAETLAEPLVLTLAAVASVLTGETVGDSSVFRAQSDLLVGSTGLEGVLEEIEIRGRRFQGVAIDAGPRNGP
jgi:hypothetical protein